MMILGRAREIKIHF